MFDLYALRVLTALHPAQIKAVARAHRGFCSSKGELIGTQRSACNCARCALDFTPPPSSMARDTTVMQYLIKIVSSVQVKNWIVFDAVVNLTYTNMLIAIWGTVKRFLVARRAK